MKKSIVPILLVLLFLSACGNEETIETAAPPEESPPTLIEPEKVETTPKAQGIRVSAPPANISGTETKTSQGVSSSGAGSPAQISGAVTPSPSSKPLASPPPSVPAAPAEISGNATPVEAPQALKKCVACHTFEKGGAKKVGPNLYGIHGAPAGQSPGFTYTDAFLKVFQGKKWNDENLNAWLTDSKKMVPNSKMGIKLPDAQERASIIQYLRGLR